MTFGEYAKKQRHAHGFSLRSFCIATRIDPSNWSKVERGAMSPGPKPLDAFIATLGLTGDDEQEARDLAALYHDRVPDDITDDERLLNMLPVTFCALRKLDTPEKREAFIAMLREHT